MTGQIQQKRTGRALNVGLAVVIGGAVVGFFVGTRNMPRPWIQQRGDDVGVQTAGVVPGQAYWQLRSRQHGRNSQVTSDLQRLRAELPDLFDEVQRSPALTQAALTTRAQRRVFDGAPPMVPHVIDEQSAAACLACHASGIRVQGRTATVMSHEPLASCTQCHAPTLPRFWGQQSTAANSFVGRTSSGSGERAWQGAPPTIPHSLHMREDCASCHGVAGLEGIRTSHPDRHSCTQCHAPRDLQPW